MKNKIKILKKFIKILDFSKLLLFEKYFNVVLFGLQVYMECLLVVIGYESVLFKEEMVVYVVKNFFK